MTKLLDCTLRDGGYYNKWDFDSEIVRRYLNAVALSGVEYIELGLRNFPQEGFLGPFAYTTENYLNSLELPNGPKYGVMVDAKTILGSGMDVSAAISSLFTSKQSSKITLVRVAAHFHEVESCGPIVEGLAQLGYEVGFNLMQAGGKPSELIAEKAMIASQWRGLTALYFADSLGNMDASEVTRIITAIRESWSGELGIHTHDNMNLAISNTLVAMNNGVSWLDCTVTGMGRGAGNAQTEKLMALLVDRGESFNPQKVYELVLKDFEPMQKKFGWGSNILYFLGAQNNIHPTYIQTLLSSTHYGVEELVGAVDYLSQLQNVNSFEHAVLEKSLSINSAGGPVTGSGKLQSAFHQREVLIIGGGASVCKYGKDILHYIKSRKPIVVSINVNESIPAESIDYYCVSHNAKFLSQSGIYSDITKPMILPLHRFSGQEIEHLPNVEIYEYGIELGENFGIHKEHCTLTKDLTLAYGLAVALNGGSNQISLVGVDGYGRGDSRQLEMIELWESIKATHPEKNIVALTPTSYPIEQSSLYAYI